MNPKLFVKKKDGLTMLRDQNGYPYPEGNFEVTRSTYVNRLLNAGDLELIVNTEELKKEIFTKENSTKTKKKEDK